MTQALLTDNFYGTNADVHLVNIGAPGYFDGTLTLANNNLAAFDATGASSHTCTSAQNINMPATVADLFVWTNLDAASLPSLPLPGSDYYNATCGIVKDANNQMFIEVGWNAARGHLYSTDLVLFIGGGQTNLGGFIGTSEIPSAIGMSLLGNVVTPWARLAAGWTQLGASINVSSHYDFTAGGALTGWYAACGLTTSGATNATLSLSRIGSGPSSIVLLPPYQSEVITDGAGSYVPGHEATAATLLDVVQNVTNSWGGIPATPAVSGFTVGLGNTGVGFDNVSGGNGLSFNNPLAAPNSSPQMSLEAWFITSDTQTGSGGLGSRSVLLFADISGFGFNDWGVGWGAPMNPSFGSGTTGTDVQLDSPIAYNDGQLHHIVVTFDDSTGTVNMYVDTVLIATSSSFATTPIAGAALWWCGKNAVGWVGKANNWAVYPIALTPTQIAEHYNLGLFSGTCPNVVGLDLSVAESTITADNLTVGSISTVSNGAPPNQVISQSPLAGAAVTVGEAVNLVVSLGLGVPDVVNTSATLIAPTIITGAGFVVGTITYIADVLIIAGNVISQHPAAGSFAGAGTPINLVVSTGRGGLFVPDLIGLMPAAGDTLLESLGLQTGAVSSAPSLAVPAGEIMAQNPQEGTPVAYGSFVSYIVSLGIPTANTNFDFEATVISQYANSPTIQQLVQSMNGYIDQTQNFENFYNFVWNVDTAEGFGLDIWGRIVNVSRLLQIPTGQTYVGFQDGSSTGPGPGWDVQPFGKAPGDPPGAGGQGTWYTRIAATQAYLLEDEPYRQLILTKALANIVNTTVPAFNQLLQNLFPGRGNPYVTTSGVMAMTFTFDFDLTPIELAILEQSGAVPVPPGVSFTIVVP